MAIAPLVLLAGEAVSALGGAWGTVTAAAEVVTVLHAAQLLIGQDTSETKQDTTDIKGMLANIQGGVDAIGSLNVDQLTAWVQQIDLMVLDLFARPEPWYEPPGISAEMLAARTTLRQVYGRADTAADLAASASSAAMEAKEAVAGVVETVSLLRDLLSTSILTLGYYTLDASGMAAYEADQASGSVVGDGPVLIRQGQFPAFNPNFFTYVGRNGNRYPITSDLLASVLNMLNLYPR